MCSDENMPKNPEYCQDMKVWHFKQISRKQSEMPGALLLRQDPAGSVEPVEGVGELWHVMWGRGEYLAHRGKYHILELLRLKWGRRSACRASTEKREVTSTRRPTIKSRCHFTPLLSYILYPKVYWNGQQNKGKTLLWTNQKLQRPGMSSRLPMGGLDNVDLVHGVLRPGQQDSGPQLLPCWERRRTVSWAQGEQTTLQSERSMLKDWLRQWVNDTFTLSVAPVANSMAESIWTLWISANIRHKDIRPSFVTLVARASCYPPWGSLVEN